MQLPKDDRSKQGLGLVQPFLVFQIFLPQNRDRPFSLEIGVTDGSRTRRRLLLSASSHEAQTNAMLARLPLAGLRRGTWLNLCLDLDSLVRGSFGQVLKSLDSLAVHSECRLRKIFTLRSPPQPEDLNQTLEVPAASTATTENDGLEGDRRAAEPIPRAHDFPTGIDQLIHVVGADQVFSPVEERPQVTPDCPSPPPGHQLQASQPPQQAAGSAGAAAQLLQQLQQLQQLQMQATEEAFGSHSMQVLAAQAAEAESQTEGMGYEDMVRRVSLLVEEEERARAAAAVAATTSVEVAAPPEATPPEVTTSSRRKLLVPAPKSRPPKSAEAPEAHRTAPVASAVAPAPKAASTVPSLMAAGAAAAGLNHSAGVRRPKSKAQRRPESLTALQAGRGIATDTRRMPNTARGPRERSPSGGTRQAKMRPLPLEMGPSRLPREDPNIGGPSQPSSSSSASVSSRRGRKPGRLGAAVKTGDEEPISPSPTAATRRRHLLAMKTLHKTAEIYGAPVGPHGHRHPPAARPLERPEAQACPGRPEEGQGYPLVERPAFNSTLELPAEPPGAEEVRKAEDESDAEPSPPGATGVAGVDARPLPFALPRPQGERAERKSRPPALEPGSALPPVQQEADGVQRTPRSWQSLTSPSQVLAAQAEAEDEIVVFGPSCQSSAASLVAAPTAAAKAASSADKPRKTNFDWSKALEASAHSYGSADAWSAFGSTVRHADGPPLSARFRPGGQQQGNAPRPGGAGPATASAGFELSLAPRSSPKAPAAARNGEEPRAVVLQQMAAGADEKGPVTSGYLPEKRRPMANASPLQRPVQPLSSHARARTESDGRQPRSPLETGGGSDLDDWEQGPSEDYEVEEEEWLEAELDAEAASPEPEEIVLRLGQHVQRRIKSSSPPRRSGRRPRPQPFSNLDKVQDAAQPSSAPAESERRRDRPLPQLLGGIPAEPEEHTPASASAVAEAPAPVDAQHRPFTPPVVPIGRLLRAAQDSSRRAASNQAAAKAEAPEAAEPSQRDEEKATVDKDNDMLEDAEAEEESMLEAVYDPMLDIYYDPVSNRYYERRQPGDDFG
eukprot:TRINITY_DN33848_c0_g1_i1.p1 TRINITY_DN33848_c0_g1~~TRINITY_DN33848_c0_g1_i1.p1  ORF type:complete len:1149 (+),score=286.76 TRINITY_DN33848_c0_g1_i1:243-3449(+)